MTSRRTRSHGSRRTRHHGSRRVRIIVAIVMTAALAACGKASDKVSEKAAEKMIESAMSKDGAKAKVDVAKGQTTITRTDDQGKTSVMEYGGVKITEADLGVPLYPGAIASRDGSTRASTPEGKTVAAGFESKDSLEKVGAFYREQLRTRSVGKQFVDTTSDDTTMLALVDEQSKSAIQVTVSKTGDQGSRIQIMSTQKVAK